MLVQVVSKRMKSAIGGAILSVIFPIIALAITVTAGFGWMAGIGVAGLIWVLIMLMAIAAKWVIDP